MKSPKLLVKSGPPVEVGAQAELGALVDTLEDKAMRLAAPVAEMVARTVAGLAAAGVDAAVEAVPLRGRFVIAADAGPTVEVSVWGNGPVLDEATVTLSVVGRLPVGVALGNLLFADIDTDVAADVAARVESAVAGALLIRAAEDLHRTGQLRRICTIDHGGVPDVTFSGVVVEPHIASDLIAGDLQARGDDLLHATDLLGV